MYTEDQNHINNISQSIKDFKCKKKMKRIMNVIFWYLARKLGYNIVLRVEKHFYYTEIKGNMPDEMVVYFV